MPEQPPIIADAEFVDEKGDSSVPLSKLGQLVTDICSHATEVATHVEGVTGVPNTRIKQVATSTKAVVVSATKLNNSFGQFMDSIGRHLAFLKVHNTDYKR